MQVPLLFLSTIAAVFLPISNIASEAFSLNSPRPSVPLLFGSVKATAHIDGRPWLTKVASRVASICLPTQEKKKRRFLVSILFAVTLSTATPAEAAIRWPGSQPPPQQPVSRPFWKRTLKSTCGNKVAKNSGHRRAESKKKRSNFRHKTLSVSSNDKHSGSREQQRSLATIPAASETYQRWTTKKKVILATSGAVLGLSLVPPPKDVVEEKTTTSTRFSAKPQASSVSKETFRELEKMFGGGSNSTDEGTILPTNAVPDLVLECSNLGSASTAPVLPQIEEEVRVISDPSADQPGLAIKSVAKLDHRMAEADDTKVEIERIKTGRIQEATVKAQEIKTQVAKVQVEKVLVEQLKVQVDEQAGATGHAKAGYPVTTEQEVEVEESSAPTTVLGSVEGTVKEAGTRTRARKMVPQPRSEREDERLRKKYEALPLEERAYQILVDLGMFDDEEDIA